DLPAAGSDNTASVRMAYDARNLYVAYSVADTSLIVNTGGRDGEVWNGDSVELMIDAANDKATAIHPNHYHILLHINGHLTDNRGNTAGGWDRSWTTTPTYDVVRPD